MKTLDFQKYNIFPSFRTYQEETIKKIVEFCTKSPKKYLLVQAPTGSGKSIMAYVAARYLTEESARLKSLIDTKKASGQDIDDYNHSIKDAYLLTSKNLLLDQYYNDFNKHMPICKGRKHYRCIMDRRPCDEALCLTKASPSEMPCYSKCTYQNEKMKMFRAKVSATNFAYLLKLLKLPTTTSKDLVIVDECQAIEAVLRDEFVVSVTEKNINVINDIKEAMSKGEGHEVLAICMHHFEKYHGSLRKIDITKVDYNSLEDVNAFLGSIYKDIAQLYLSLSYALERYVKENFDGDEEAALTDPEFKELIKKSDRIKCFTSSIRTYYQLKSSIEWVVEEHKTGKGIVTGFELKPVTIELLTTGIFNRLAQKKVVMTSATIGDPQRFSKSLGIPFEDVEFINVPSTFPIENRPFIKWPICSMSYKDMDKNMPKIAEACDAILEMYPNQKGIVHSVSFKNAIFLKEHMRNSDRVLIHDQVNKENMLQLFKASDNKVLISPSLIEGFDFKGKLSEFQIFIKVPYLSLGDKVVARRLQLDEEWYINNAVLQILQGVGRSVRSETDVASTFCLDKNINFLLGKYRYLFTEDFLKTVVDVGDFS